MKDDAIVLHARPYGDTDAVVALFARQHGRVSLFARHLRASKRKETPLVPMHEISLELIRRPGSDLYLSRAVDLQRTHLALSQDLIKLSAANVVLELLREMFRDGENDERMYAIAAHTLEQLETADAMTTVMAFEHALLQSLGIAAEDKHFRDHTRAFEHQRGRELPARAFFVQTLRL